MERNQTWLIVGVFVAFVVTMAAFNSNSGGKRLRSFSARFGEIDATGMVSGADGRMGRIEGAYEPQAATEDRAQSQDEVIKPIKATDKKVVEAKKAAKTDPKKVVKKKKKKKKVVKAGTKAPDAPSSTDDSESEFETDETDDSAETYEVAEAYVAPQPTKEPKAKEIEAIPTTEKEWEALILGAVNPKNVEKLVSYYRARVVKEEVFYSIITKMLADKRPEMQALAVKALDATPSSKSFSMLVQIAYEETTPALQKLAQSYLLRYRSVSYLPALSATLRNPASTTQAQLEALKFLTEAASSIKLTPSESDPTVPATPAAASTQAKYFQPFVSILTAMQSNEAIDAQVKSAAADALTKIQAIVGYDPSLTPVASM